MEEALFTAMDDILDEVKKLSVKDLRSKLIEVGEKVGPITGTTQNLFQKRLAKRLYQIQHPDLSTEEAKENDKVNNNTETVVNPKHEDSQNKPQENSLHCKETAEAQIPSTTSGSDEPSAFFGVCLPQGIDKKVVEGKKSKIVSFVL